MSLLHGQDLAAAGVGPEHDAWIGRVEGVLHVARGMVGRHVQVAEVQLVGDDVRAAVGLEAHVAEDARNAAHDQGRRVEAAELRSAARQGDVELVGVRIGRCGGAPECFLALLESSLERRLDLVDPLPEGGSLRRLQLPHPAGQELNFALAADGCPAPLLELIQVGCRFQGRGDARFDVVELVDHGGVEASLRAGPWLGAATGARLY